MVCESEHWDELRFWTLGWIKFLNIGIGCVSEHWDGLWIWTLGWVAFLNIGMDCESEHWNRLRFWTLGRIVNLNLGWVAFLILKELAKRLCYWLWEWGERGVDQRRENDQRMIRNNGAKCSRDQDIQDWWQTVNRDEPARQPGQVHVDLYHCPGDRGAADQKNNYHKKMKFL